jgi:hypothetical protein
MRYLQNMVIVGTVLLLFFPLPADADSDSNPPEKWRNDPERYESLRHGLQAFLSLPEGRQKRLRQLDQDLHDEDSATSVRLQRVLDRYAEWLQRLPDADRQRVQRETDPKKRLQLIREIREREWIKRLPKATREELQKLPADQQSVRVTQLRQEDRKRREEWQFAIRNWSELVQSRPQMARIEELTPEVKIFVEEALRPLLTADEWNRLLQSQGKNPLFLRTLVELADKHPMKLPPGTVIGPTRFEELPSELQARLTKVKDWPPAAAQPAEGKWPEYALEVVAFARAHKVTLPKQQLGPCRPAEFSPSVRRFREEQLLPALGADDVALLNKAEGNWPRYPRLLLQMARKHGLQMPGMRLPGPADMWSRYRTTPTVRVEPMPEVPDHTLLEFAHSDLKPEEQASLPTLWLADPASRSKVNQMYLERNQDVLRRLRQADQKAHQKKQAGTKR